MVKRKAEVSIDEWLTGGTPIPVDSSTATVAAEVKLLAPRDPTVEVASTNPAREAATVPVSAEPVIAPVTKGAVSIEDEGHWFWALLEESGYERW